MGRHDWYRKGNWSQDDRADFFARLARSRSGRSQYLLIQALHFRSAGIAEPALQLVEQYLSEFPPTDMFHVGALLQRAQCLEALGRIEEAEAAYLTTLGQQRTIQNYVTLVYIEFPWFAVKYGRRHLYSEALAALDAGASGFVSRSCNIKPVPSGLSSPQSMATSPRRNLTLLRPCKRQQRDIPGFATIPTSACSANRIRRFTTVSCGWPTCRCSRRAA